ncbi:unnamed protein product [Effrenium voratum]|uniref:Uncharacterized protein n=1 Tax=Effrenium voratum TaxID=2562239 RepID=A0AA36HPU5_9DINO|nr:unnamed protein product [Effrenium voratum]
MVAGASPGTSGVRLLQHQPVRWHSVKLPGGVLETGESCEASCPPGLVAELNVSCKDTTLQVPDCLAATTSTTTSTTSSASTTSATTSTTTSATTSTTSSTISATTSTTSSTISATSTTSSTTTSTMATLTTSSTSISRTSSTTRSWTSTLGSTVTNSTLSTTTSSSSSSTTSSSTSTSSISNSSTTSTTSTSSSSTSSTASNSTTSSTTASSTSQTMSTRTNTTTSTTSSSSTSSSTSSTTSMGHGCTIAFADGTTCPRYMMPAERCAAHCPGSSSAGHFICLHGRFFGSSGCQEAGATAWRGPLLAAALHVGVTSRSPLSSEVLQESLRRSLAVCLGMSSSSIVRLRVLDLVAEGQSPEVLANLELQFEVSLGAEQANFTEVAEGIEELTEVSTPAFLLLQNMMKGYFNIQIRWVEVAMRAVPYDGSILNLTLAPVSTGDSGDAAAEMQDQDGTATISGVVLSMTIIPVVAVWVRFILAERRVGREALSGEERGAVRRKNRALRDK